MRASGSDSSAQQANFRSPGTQSSDAKNARTTTKMRAERLAILAGIPCTLKYEFDLDAFENLASEVISKLSWNC